MDELPTILLPSFALILASSFFLRGLSVGGAFDTFVMRNASFFCYMKKKLYLCILKI